MSKKLTFKDLGLDVTPLIMDSMYKMGVMMDEKVDDLQRQIDELKSGNIISKEIDRQLMPGGKLAK